jgi:transposase
VLGKAAWRPESMAALRALARPIEQCQTRDELWAGHLHLELGQLDHLQAQIEKLDAKLDAPGAADARVVRLRTIPGVGPRRHRLARAGPAPGRAAARARDAGDAHDDGAGAGAGAGAGLTRVGLTRVGLTRVARGRRRSRADR